MTCGGCGTVNPEGHRFCGGCGSPLAASCPSCGAPAVAGFAFCGSCGSSLNAAPAVGPTPTLERRVCSVLFADLVGFTPLSESRDPEEVRALLSRYFETARTVIARYGGVVEKFIGDAVMAVWGTPVATEGDAERAVRAALDLVAQVAALGEEIGAPGLALRAGVVTGEVAATMGAVGEGMVAGDAVNTAARVQSAAAPGTVWVDSTTQRLSSSAIGFTDAGEHALKGKSEPMSLWQATWVLGNVGGAQRIDGLEAPMTGRGPEERTLRELFHASIDRRTPRLVVVSGPAGIGKSRLGWELEKYVDGLAFSVNWHRGRCLSYGDGVAYWALAEAVRQRFGIGDGDTAAVATTAFLERLPVLVPDPEERAFVGPRLGRLLGLEHPDDPGTELSRDDLFAGWRLFLERLADESPVVLLVEDAQHADDGLLDFCEHLVDWARQAPIYVVLFARSELVDARPGLGVGRNRSQLGLDLLDPDSMTTLVTALVRDLPANAVEAICAHAQGNPLFAVETIRSLVDRDVIQAVDGEYRLIGDASDLSALAVPDSLHGLLAARLDALDPDLRGLVADAAVLGGTFPAEALVAVSGRSAADVTAGLGELVRRGVFDISTDVLSPQRGSYAFEHGLLRQVAYDTLSRHDRAARHLAVAAHLQNVFTDGGEEVMDVVAQHYLDALDNLGERDRDRAAQVTDRAISALTRAAERSTRAGSPSRAARSLASAAGLETDRVRAAGLWESSAKAATTGGDLAAAEAAAQTAVRLYDELGDARASARALAHAAYAVHRARRHTEARELAETALVTLRPEPDVDTVEALIVIANVCAFSERTEESLRYGDEALSLAQAIDTPVRTLASAFVASGISYMFAQRRAESSAALRYGLELARQVGDSSTLARAGLNLGALLLAEDPTEGLATLRTSTAQARQHGDRAYLDSGTWNLGMARILIGEWDQAVLDLERAVVDDGLGTESESAILLRILRALRGEPPGPEPGMLADFRSSEDYQDRWGAAFHDVAVALVTQEPERALAIARPWALGGEAFDVGTEFVIWCWPAVTRAALAQGDVDYARAMVATLDQIPVGYLAPATRSSRMITLAALASLDGDVVQADELFAAGIARLREHAAAHQLAHALLDQADHLGRTARDGRSQREEAAAIGERLGAIDVARRLTGSVVA